MSNKNITNVISLDLYRLSRDLDKTIDALKCVDFLERKGINVPDSIVDDLMQIKNALEKNMLEISGGTDSDQTT
jgi:hypothetical protein